MNKGGEDQHILAITNVTGRECRIEIPMSDIGSSESRWYNLVERKAWSAGNQKLRITLQPYDVKWLQPSSELAHGKSRNRLKKKAITR